MLLSIFRSKWTTVIWFLGMNVLFFMPGSDLPQHGWFDAIPQFDKLVHFGLFAVFLFLFAQAFKVRLPAYGWALLLMALGYGLLIEFVQKAWVPGRTFDLMDVLADFAGAIAGVLATWGLYKKNKPL